MKVASSFSVNVCFNIWLAAIFTKLNKILQLIFPV